MTKSKTFARGPHTHNRRPRLGDTSFGVLSKPRRQRGKGLGGSDTSFDVLVKPRRPPSMMPTRPSRGWTGGGRAGCSLESTDDADAATIRPARCCSAASHIALPHGFRVRAFETSAGLVECGPSKHTHGPWTRCEGMPEREAAGCSLLTHGAGTLIPSLIAFIHPTGVGSNRRRC